MLYMFLALPASAAIGHATGGMGAMSASPAASRFSFLAPLAPRCAALCQIAMGITMGYALILML